MEQKRSVEFTRGDTKVVKAVAVMLMVIHHLFGFPERLGEGVDYVSLISLGGKTAELYLAIFGKICVPIFAFMGGYGTYISCRGKEGQLLTNVLWRKIIGLYRQYWLVFLVFIPICVFCGVSRVTPSLLDLIWNFSGIETYYNGEWWFFTPYMLLMVTYPALAKLSNKIHSIFIEFLAVVICNTAVHFILPVIPSYTWGQSLVSSFAYGLFWDTAMLLPQFWMGCLFAKHNLLSLMKEKLSGNLLYVLVALVISALCVYMYNVYMATYVLVQVPIFVVCIVVALNHKWGKWIRKILIYIGTESTFIWLTHSFFCYHLCQKLVFAPKYSILVVVWLLVMCLVTAKLLRLLMKIMDLGWVKIKPLFSIQPLED